MSYKKYLIPITLIGIFFTPSVFANEPIPITISFSLDKVIFDGKWSFSTEWKQSSLETIYYQKQPIAKLRIAHQDNFIYVFLDFLSDNHIDKGADRAIICFDVENDKTSLPNSNDYCFMAVLEGKRSFVYQGGSPLAVNGNFKLITEPDGFLAVGGVSDESDPYTKTIHPSYEFRIPIDYIGRTDNYGFFVGLFDSFSGKVHTWPEDIIIERNFQIPSPESWGEIISPDKSIPEFEWPILAVLPALIVVVFITKLRKNAIHLMH